MAVTPSVAILTRKVNFMKKTREFSLVPSLAALLVVTMILFGCGTPHTVTMRDPEDLSGYDKLYVAEIDISSAEESEEAVAANARYAQFTSEAIRSALAQKPRYSVVDLAGPTLNTLCIETTIRVVYGSRAARWVLGFGAGEGTIDISMRLVDPATNKIKMDLHSSSELSVGAFGGSMDSVIEASIKQTVAQFVEKL